jgi:peptidyl-prolyl cis-trans isomerase D
VLKFIRRNASAAWVKFMFVAIVVVFVFWGMGGIVGGERAQFVVRINDEAIPPAEFIRAYNNILRMYQDAYKDNFKPEMAKALGLKNRTVDTLIRASLMRQEAKRIGLGIDDAEVRDAIASLPAFQQDGRFNKQLYIRILRASRISPGEFEESEQEELQVRKLQDLIVAGVHVSEKEVLERYRVDHEQVNLRFIKLDSASFIPQVQLTDQDVQAYYDKHRDTFREPDRVRIEYVLYPPDKFAGEAQVSDAEVQKYYDEHAAEYDKPEQVHARHILFRFAPGATAEDKAKVRQHAQEVLAKVKAGEDFAALAKQYSEDASAAQGGDLGTFTRGKMVAPFERAAFSLAPGETSDLVESPFGLHIIKVESKEPAHTQTLDEVRAQITDKLKQEKARELAQARAEADRAKVAGGEKLADVAQASGLSVATPAPFARADVIAGLGRNPDLSDAAFKAAAGEVGPVTDTKNGCILFRVVEKLPAHVPELSAIRDRVETAVRNERAQALAKAAAETMLAELQKTPDIDAVAKTANAKADTAKALDAKVEETGGFTRQAASIPKLGAAPELKKAAFQLTPEKPVAPAVYDVGGSSVVAVLKERIPADEEKFKTEKANLIKQAEERRKQEVMEQFVDYLKAHASIQISDDYLASIAETGHELGGGPLRR